MAQGGRLTVTNQPLGIADRRRRSRPATDGLFGRV
jgi:hypothetical protein